MELILSHPDPFPKRDKSIWPIFLPFAGCKQRCVFCAQDLSTGQAKVGEIKLFVQNELQKLKLMTRENGRVYGLGFFGGTFTGLDLSLQAWILERASQLRWQGVIDFICFSTRPDRIEQENVALLKEYQVDLVELGIQSFNSGVLLKSKRGYTVEAILKTVGLLKQAGLNYGFQLLPGLPGHSLESFWEDLRWTLILRPKTIRIYPCLVLDNTLLARWYHNQEYTPWSLDKTIYALGLGLVKLWSARINVLRLGLTPEKSLVSNILAGPWHPSLGFLVRSFALNYYLRSKLSLRSRLPKRAIIPKRYYAEWIGYKRKFLSEWTKLIPLAQIKQGEGKDFIFAY